MKFIKRNEGAISIFLCIVLLVMIVLAGVLVDGTRLNFSKTQVESALDSSSKSALANYNYKLKELYGLMALSDSDPEVLKDGILYYFERNLMVRGIEDEEEASFLDFFGFGGKEEIPPLDLYDYRVEDLKVQPVYNLSEPEVLRAQILEYMKYRGPKALVTGLMDKFKIFGDFKKQTDILEKKIDVDEDLTDIKKHQIKASDNMATVNSFGRDLDVSSKYEELAEHVADAISLEKDCTELEKEIEELDDDLKSVTDEIEKYQDEIMEIETELMQKMLEALAEDKTPPDTSAEEERIRLLGEKVNELQEGIKDKIAEKEEKESKLNTKKEELNSKRSKISEINNKILNNLKKFIDAAKDTVSSLETVRDKSVRTVEKIDSINEELEGEVNEFSDFTRMDLGSKKETISAEDINPKIDEVKHNLSILESIKKNIEESKADKLTLDDFSGRVPGLNEVKEKLNTGFVKEQIKSYKGMENGNAIDYYVDKGAISEKSDDEEDPRDFFNEFVKSGGVEDDENKIEENLKEIPKDAPSKEGYRPTDIDVIENDEKIIEGILKIMEEMEYTSSEYSNDILYSGGKGLEDFDAGSMSFSKSGSVKKALSLFSKMAELFVDGVTKVRDDMYINEYIMGNFLNYTTNPEKDYDLRGRLMKERPAFFDANNADVEYILIGSEEESINILGVKAQITLIRFALNAIAIYTDPQKVNAALKTATAVAGWTAIGVPIVHTLIMMGWAMAESMFDVSLLMRGESIPIFKTRNTWITDPKNMGTKIREIFEKEAKKKAKEVSGYLISQAEGMVAGYVGNAGDVLEDYILSKVDALVDKAFIHIENPIREGMHSAENIFKDLEQSINVKLEGEVGNIINSIGNHVESLLNNKISIFKNSTLGDFDLSKDIIMGADFTELFHGCEEFQVFKGMKVEDAVKELKMLISKGETIGSFTVEETSLMVNSLIFNTIENTKEKIKEEIKGMIQESLNRLKEKFNEVISKAAMEGKEKVNESIDSIGNSPGTIGKGAGGVNLSKGKMETNLKASLVSMNYSDYLRLLLLFESGEKKLKRIADLIEMNMRKETGDVSFSMSNCSTYIRVEATVSIKYLFMTQPFMPEEYRRNKESRIEFTIPLYKGY